MLVLSRKKEEQIIIDNNIVITVVAITILAEAAELAPEIDVERAKRAKERAEKRLKQLSSEDKEFYSSMGALERAMNRLTVASRRR